MLFERWALNAKEKPSKENNFGNFPADSTHACYGHGLNETTNKNFCFTAMDLGLATCFGEHFTQERNVHMSDR